MLMMASTVYEREISGYMYNYASRSDCFIRLSASVVIGQSGYYGFGFGFTTLGLSVETSSRVIFWGRNPDATPFN